ncbi:RNase H family protein [Pseudoclavibacter soli]|uniref:mycothiol-dependent nitroreductase Rv2466c family protein n=1 Tax=Pseudoclavibacter soli TaxID=452623 RepID=UPI0003FEC045
MTITAAADGSALGNPGPAGWAWVIDDQRWAAGGWPHATNNRGELQAVIELLRATAAADEPLRVLCDSQYVINSVTKWMPGWKRRGWKKSDGKPVLNRDLLEQLDEALTGRQVRFEWVKGHAGHPLNEAADRHAQDAALAYQRNAPVPSGPGFTPAAEPTPVAEAAPASPAAEVECFFDPSCPWAWMTSRWLTEVAEVRGLAVTWRVMSLALLPQNQQPDERHARFFERSQQYCLLVARVQAEVGLDAVKALYDELGRRIHHDRRRDVEAVARESLAAAGLDQALFEADLTRYLPVLAESTTLGTSRVGDDVGTPILTIAGHSFFGPVVSPAPTGDAALRLFDGLALTASVPGFFELKRTRDVGPIFEA